MAIAPRLARITVSVRLIIAPRPLSNDRGTAPLDAGALVAALLPDQKIFFLRLAAFGRCNHPARHPPATGPRVPRLVAVLDGDFAARALAATLAPQELADVEAVLLGDTHDLLADRRALCVLLVHLHAFNVRLHFRKLSKGHVLKFLRTCHGASAFLRKLNLL
jgi:hypothetical protein